MKGTLVNMTLGPAGPHTTFIRRQGMLGKIKKLLRRQDEEGQGLVKYGLILGLIAVVAIAALNATGTNVNSIFSNIAGKLGTAAGA